MKKIKEEEKGKLVYRFKYPVTTRLFGNWTVTIQQKSNEWPNIVYRCVYDRMTEETHYEYDIELSCVIHRPDRDKKGYDAAREYPHGLDIVYRSSEQKNYLTKNDLKQALVEYIKGAIEGEKTDHPYYKIPKYSNLCFALRGGYGTAEKRDSELVEQFIDLVQNEQG